ncbi:hypothetical protein GP486_004367 [Trichoglossum hirsutum]|uniref:NACHT-NTPase and P-loop NTPases N-terminal domain-containing protein n=1 Tax=Trichoglossum hirsutum TaxID=265104 RepID=A0A9P8LAZ3_9PEZI|nr:hypothetical protein GP486_004367 [Trichoglossum hirsutum]
MSIGMAGTIIDIAVFGARLAMRLFAFSEDVATATDQINSIASEIYLFSTILKQLDEILKEDEAMCSPNLMEAVNVILDQCRPVFKEISDVLSSTRGVSRRGSGESLTMTERVAWPFKKSKCKRLKATLKSMKSTLVLMLQTLLDPTMRSNVVARLESLIKITQVSQDRLREVEEEYSPEGGIGAHGPSSTSLVFPQQLPNAVPLAVNGEASNSGSLSEDRKSTSGQGLALARPGTVTVGYLLNRWTNLQEQPETTGVSSGGRRASASTERPTLQPEWKSGKYYPSNTPLPAERESQKYYSSNTSPPVERKGQKYYSNTPPPAGRKSQRYYSSNASPPAEQRMLRTASSGNVPFKSYVQQRTRKSYSNTSPPAPEPKVWRSDDEESLDGNPDKFPDYNQEDKVGNHKPNCLEAFREL